MFKLRSTGWGLGGDSRRGEKVECFEVKSSKGMAGVTLGDSRIKNDVVRSCTGMVRNVDVRVDSRPSRSFGHMQCEDG